MTTKTLMTKKPHRYSDVEKAAALRMLLDEGRSYADVTRTTGISEPTLAGWKKAEMARRNPPPVPKPEPKTQLTVVPPGESDEVRGLREQVRGLEGKLRALELVLNKRNAIIAELTERAMAK